MSVEIKNLKKVAQRILKAIKKKERIILYSDSDLDGTTALIILKETIKNLGGNISAVYFPDRETEGYGITEKGLNYLKKFSPCLLISLDLGIGNFKEVKLAKKLKFEVIIIDHHEILDKIPEAEIVVDPKQKGDKYPFKEFATVGIIFKLSEILLKDKMTDLMRRNFLELTAMATIADMMPQKEENKIFIEEGIKTLENSFRPGIKTFFEMDLFEDFPNFERKLSKIISILNVRDVEQGKPASYRVLISSSSEESGKIIKRLLEKNEFRREEIANIVKEIEEGILLETSPIIFEGSCDWDFALISAAASIICHRYQKSTFLFKKLEKESIGTIRASSGINSVNLMKKCSKYLLTYGGHPAASGFRLKNENLEKFKECLIKQLK